MLSNPFRPSFGVTPLVFAGRKQLLANFRFSLLEGIGSPYRFSLVQGARGTGKTVFLNQLETTAQETDWEVVRVRSTNLIDDLVLGQLPRLLNRISSTTDYRISQIGIGGVGSIGITTDQRYPEGHTIWTLMNDAATTLTKQNRGLFLTLDELQSANPAELHQLTDAIQDSVRDGLNIAFSFAGLPGEISKLLEHPGTTFLRRATPITIEELPAEEVTEALQATATQGGKVFDEDALELATHMCHGYAFLIQLVGSISWTMATTNRISTTEVEQAYPLVVQRMGTMVHIPALKGLPHRERQFLSALANSPGPMKLQDIGAAMDIKGSQPSTYRQRLIDRGLIQAVSHGFVDFTMPYMREHLRLESF